MPLSPSPLDLASAIATLDSPFFWSAGPISFSIPTAGSTWPGYAATTEPFNANYGVLSAPLATQFRLAIQRWDELIARSFVEKAEPGDRGDIRVALTDVDTGFPGTWGYAYSPAFQGGIASARARRYLDRPLQSS